MSGIALSREEARQFVAQCFRLRHAHPRWREWLRIALREARGETPNERVAREDRAAEVRLRGEGRVAELEKEANHG